MSGAIALGDNAALAAVSAPSAGHYLLFYRAGVLTKMAPDGTETAVGGSGGSSPPFSDATALVKDDADATKLIRVDAGTVATGTTRVLTMPNADVDLAALANANIASGAAIAESKLNLASDAAAGIPSRRTLGTSSTSSAAGNDSRLSDARTPTAHTASHNPGGSDVIQRFQTIYWVFDGTLAVTTGSKQVPIFIPTGSNTPTLVSAAARITTAPTGSAVTFDLNKGGTTVWTGGTNRLTVAASANSGSTTTFDVPTFASLDYFTVDIDTVGSTTAGTHAVFALTYRY